MVGQSQSGWARRWPLTRPPRGEPAYLLEPAGRRAPLDFPRRLRKVSPPGRVAAGVVRTGHSAVGGGETAAPPVLYRHSVLIHVLGATNQQLRARILGQHLHFASMQAASVNRDPSGTRSDTPTSAAMAMT